MLVCPLHKAHPAGTAFSAPDQMMMPPRGTVPKPETAVADKVATFIEPNLALVALTSPETVRAAPEAGAALMPTPPDAWMRNWLSPLEFLSASLLSPKTTLPGWVARARRPTAKEFSPLAMLLRPPGTVANRPEAVLFSPPPTAEPRPEAVEPLPPAITDNSPEAVLFWPPPMEL